jgi:NADH-quinone oxidoreductase subunit F
MGEKIRLNGKTLIIGGGNVAMDVARTALRVGAEDVQIFCLESREQMPAWEKDIEEALEEGILLNPSWGPKEILHRGGRVVGVEFVRCVSVFDGEGRFNPVFDDAFTQVVDANHVLVSIGQRVDLALLEGIHEVQRTSWNTVVVDGGTKQTGRPKIFSAGDCETGPDALITACAGGRKAAENIDRFIQGLPLEYDDGFYFDQLFKSLKLYDPEEKIKKAEPLPRHQPAALPPETRRNNFDEVELALSSQEAVAEAERCLRCYRIGTVAV